MTQTEFLLNTLEYYTSDINRRCVSSYDECFYSPINAYKQGISEGCSIGRWLKPELQTELDNIIGPGGVCNQNTFYKLPEFMKELSKEFLTEIQMFHDTSDCWCIEGLTNKGKIYLSKIVTEFKLDKNLFAKY